MFLNFSTMIYTTKRSPHRLKPVSVDPAQVELQLYFLHVTESVPCYESIPRLLSTERLAKLHSLSNGR